jgi:hypothetical protein
MPDWLSIVLGVGGLIVAAAGVALGELRAHRAQADARRERAQRERIEAAMQAPEVVAELRSLTDGGWDFSDRNTVYLRLVNKGPTVATDVRFGVKIDEFGAAAIAQGGAQVHPALAPGEDVDGTVHLPESFEGLPRDRIQSHIVVWAEWRDKLGNGHTREF